MGEINKDTASSYDKIGIIYDNMCDYSLALEYYETSLKIRLKK